MSAFNWVNSTDYNLTQLKTHKIYLISYQQTKIKQKENSFSVYIWGNIFIWLDTSSLHWLVEIQVVSHVIPFYAEDLLFHILPVIFLIRVLKSVILMGNHTFLLSPVYSLFHLQGEFEYGGVFSLMFSWYLTVKYRCYFFAVRHIESNSTAVAKWR